MTAKKIGEKAKNKLKIQLTFIKYASHISIQYNFVVRR